MKGKLVYTTVVEKEIEIPDEIITIHEKSWWDWTDEESDTIDNFTDSIWSTVEEKDFQPVGVYYGENGEDYVLAQY